MEQKNPLVYNAGMDIRAVKFRVGSEWRVGGLYSPSIAGRYGAVLCLHGFPGVQKHEDIVTELCRRGLVVFMPHFRGSWGSSGLFTVSGALDDARAAHHLLSKYKHVDAKRLGIIGISLGGWLALRLAAERLMKATVVLAPAVEAKESDSSASYVRKNIKILKIPAMESLVEDCLYSFRSVPIKDYVARISPCPLLFIQGMKDQMVLPETTRRLWGLAREPKQLIELADEAHEFQSNRALVVQIVCDWIEQQLALPLASAELAACLAPLDGRPDHSSPR